jgi:hypothetical protein
MDFRFLAAGILAAALGFVSGSTVFAAPRRAVDPALAQAADERAAVAAAAAISVPPAVDLPTLPKLPPPPKLPDVNAVLRLPKVRVVLVRQTRTPVRPAAARGPSQHEHDGSDHERGDD